MTQCCSLACFTAGYSMPCNVYPPPPLPPVPTGTPLATLAQRRPLAAAERDARLRTVAQRLERQGIPSSLNNTVRSSDIKQMFFAVDEVFITVHKSNCRALFDSN